MSLEVRENLSGTKRSNVPCEEQHGTTPRVKSRRIETAVQRLRIQAALQYAGFHLRQQDGSLRSIGERYAADVELEPKDDGWVVRMRVLIKAPELHQEAVVGVLDPLADELNDLQIITRGDGHIEFRRQQYEPGIVDTRAVTVAFTETLSQAAWVHKQITGDWE